MEEPRMAKPKCRWESPSDWSEWSVWLAGGAPGPADQKYLYGHIWVTLSLCVHHRLWGAVALPLRAMLYIRQQTLPTIPKKRGWEFRTKLDLAARLVEWIAPIVKKAGKTLWVVVDGFYTKFPFLKRALSAGVVVVGRLRKDAALRD